MKSAILKYFVLTEKSDNKNCPRMIGKKLQGYSREKGHTHLDNIFSGNKQHFKVKFGEIHRIF